MSKVSIANEAEARELAVYIENDGHLYKTFTIHVIANLKRKHRAKTYDSQKAIDLWGHVAKAGASKYRKDYGPMTGGFNAATRRLCASMLEASYFESVVE